MDTKLTMLPSLQIKSWSEESLSNLALKISNTAHKPLILVDGVGGSGKTTLAVKLADILNANLVHSDDVSWCADPVHWDDEMLAGIINPWLRGRDVTYRPSGWIKENRSGFIDVDASKALIIEGMGTIRKSLNAVATCSIWVDTEPELARERVVQRDFANGENGETIESITEFADWWDSLLIPLYMQETPWEYVDVIVSGSKSSLITNNLLIHIPEFNRMKKT